MNRLLISLLLISFLTGCINSSSSGNAGQLVARRGSPPSQVITWSPTDENKILVTASETPIEPAIVYVLDLKTAQKEVLVQRSPGRFFTAQWAPDGKHVLIFSGGSTAGFEKVGWWLVDIQTKMATYQIPSQAAAWSPDGKMIAVLYEEQIAENVNDVQLQLVSVDSKKTETITTYNAPDHISGPSWSPDSKQVVFSLGQSGDEALYILDVGTRQARKLTGNIAAEYPAWSPSGKVIAFEKYPTLRLIEPDGSCETELSTVERGWSPTWSPDGQKIAYLNTDGIYILDAQKVLGRDISEGLCP